MPEPLSPIRARIRSLLSRVVPGAAEQVTAQQDKERATAAHDEDRRRWRDRQLSEAAHDEEARPASDLDYWNRNAKENEATVQEYERQKAGAQAENEANARDAARGYDPEALVADRLQESQRSMEGTAADVDRRWFERQRRELAAHRKRMRELYERGNSE